jgi:hypothetical protein
MDPRPHGEGGRGGALAGKPQMQAIPAIAPIRLPRVGGDPDRPSAIGRLAPVWIPAFATLSDNARVSLPEVPSDRSGSAENRGECYVSCNQALAHDRRRAAEYGRGSSACRGSGGMGVGKLPIRAEIIGAIEIGQDTRQVS